MDVVTGIALATGLLKVIQACLDVWEQLDDDRIEDNTQTFDQLLEGTIEALEAYATAKPDDRVLASALQQLRALRDQTQAHPALTSLLLQQGVGLLRKIAEAVHFRIERAKAPQQVVKDVFALDLASRQKEGVK